MTKPEDGELLAIEQWFAERGFTLAYRMIDGEMWADLVGAKGIWIGGRASKWKQFGGGHGAKTELDAARAAKRRYIYQEEPPPPLPRRLP